MTDKVGDKLSSLVEEFRNLIDINKSRKMRHLKARHLTKAEFDTIDQLLFEIEALVDNLDSKSNITEQTNVDIDNPPYPVNKKEMYHIDQTFLNLGISKNGGYSKKQREALGLNPAWPPELGDIESLIGSRISKEKGDLFLSLKDMHLKIKNKKKNSIVEIFVTDFKQKTHEDVNLFNILFDLFLNHHFLHQIIFHHLKFLQSHHLVFVHLFRFHLQVHHS